MRRDRHRQAVARGLERVDPRQQQVVERRVDVLHARREQVLPPIPHGAAERVAVDPPGLERRGRLTVLQPIGPRRRAVAAVALDLRTRLAVQQLLHLAAHAADLRLERGQTTGGLGLAGARVTVDQHPQLLVELLARGVGVRAELDRRAVDPLAIVGQRDPGRERRVLERAREQRVVEQVGVEVGVEQARIEVALAHPAAERDPVLELVQPLLGGVRRRALLRERARGREQGKGEEPGRGAPPHAPPPTARPGGRAQGHGSPYAARAVR